MKFTDEEFHMIIGALRWQALEFYNAANKTSGSTISEDYQAFADSREELANKMIEYQEE